MMIVTTTGYIVACIGPFFSDLNNNDASIMKDIVLRNTDSILDWTKEVIFLFYGIDYGVIFLARYYSGG